MNTQNLRHDISAAFVGALSGLPQAVAYGLIAIAPLGPDWAVFGILTSVGATILFGLVVGLWGPNRFLQSGPGAVTALMFASAISAALSRGYDAPQALALAYTGVIVAGLSQVVAARLRLGYITSYIPVPVLSGFVNASALLVFVGAVPTVLGLPGVDLFEIFSSQTYTISAWAMTVGGLTFATQVLLKGRIKRVPIALVALVVGTTLYYVGVWGADLAQSPLIGHINLLGLVGVPPLVVPGMDWLSMVMRDTASVLPWRDADIPVLTGLSIGLLASLNTVISSSAVALRTNQAVDANAELRVYGRANVLAGCLGFLPGDASPNRSAAVLEAGARTRMANYGTAIAFIVLLAALAPLVAALPLWATAGMLMAISLQAIDRTTIEQVKGVVLRHLPYPRVVFGDIAIMVTVVITAVLYDLIAAVGVGVLLSVVLFVLSMGRSPVRRIYRGSRIHSKFDRPLDELQYLEQEGQRIAVLEVQGALFFGSCARFVDEVHRLLADGVEYLILDLKHLTSIDSTGAAKLRSLSRTFSDLGGRLMISYIQPERRLVAPPSVRNTAPGNGDSKPFRPRLGNPRWVWLSLHANGVNTALGDDWFFRDTDSALVRCEGLVLERLKKATRSIQRRRASLSAPLADLTRTQIAQLGAVAKRRRYRVGERVFCQGDDASHAYFLVHGQMNVEIDIPGTNRRKRISTLSGGTIFGEMGIIDGAPRSATVTATRNSLCYALDGEGYAKLQANYPELVMTLLSNISRQFSSRLRVANIIISELDQ